MRDFALAGLIYGLALLTRPSLLFFFLVLIIWMNAIYPKNLRSNLWKFATFCITATLIVLPWILINYVKSRELIFISPNGGINLFIGNNPEANGTYKWPVKSLPIKGKKLTEIDSKAFDLALKYIVDHPKAFLIRGKWKLDYLFKPFADGVC